MANDLAEEIYPDNDDTIGCWAVLRPIDPDTPGALLSQPLTGLTDLVMFLSLSDAPDATAIHADLEIALTETDPGVSAAYEGVLLGEDKTTHLFGTLSDGDPLYAHWKSGTIYHEVSGHIWREKRAA